MNTALAHDASGEHVGRWVQREPEMELALRFVPTARRPAFIHWGALQAELLSALFELSDARVTRAKAGWWGEELLRFARDQYRHPLGERLPPGLPWTALAAAVAAVLEHDGRAEDARDARARSSPLAEALAGVEAAWFGHAAGPVDVEAVALHLQCSRLLRGRGGEDAGGIPMSLFARHGRVPEDVRGERGEAVVRDWAAELHGQAPSPAGPVAAYRRFRLQFDREQLAQLARDPARGWRPGPGSAWRCWRLARTRSRA